METIKEVILDTLYKICSGVKLSTKPDETWLHFESSSGQKCSFCIEDKFPTICASAIRGWAYDKINQEPVYYRCKCGGVEEISVSVDIEWHICKECKRRGQWEKQ